ALILAGAIGNLYDRVMFGMVRDMLWLFPGVKLPFGLTWPGGGSDELYPWVFNIADASLLVGLGILMLGMYREDKKSAKKKALGTGH
ncbi:MAG: signal peptidase II, partial [Planctomycetes bacterium]|nr:signal peptidase II [Planctomycetota bacterium]